MSGAEAEATGELTVGSNSESAASHAALVSTAVAAAARVADVLQTLPYRAGQPYDPRPVVTMAADELAVLREAVAALDGPLVLDASRQAEQFGVNVAALMSFLQLVEVLYRGLAEIPPSMAVTAGRNLATTHVIARKVRDQAGRRRR